MYTTEILAHQCLLQEGLKNHVFDEKFHCTRNHFYYIKLLLNFVLLPQGSYVHRDVGLKIATLLLVNFMALLNTDIKASKGLSQRGSSYSSFLFGFYSYLRAQRKAFLMWL